MTGAEFVAAAAAAFIAEADAEYGEGAWDIQFDISSRTHGSKSYGRISYPKLSVLAVPFGKTHDELYAEAQAEYEEVHGRKPT